MDSYNREMTIDEIWDLYEQGIRLLIHNGEVMDVVNESV